MFRLILIAILILVLYCTYNNIEMFSLSSISSELPIIKLNGRVNIELGSDNYDIHNKNNEININNYIENKPDYSKYIDNKKNTDELKDLYKKHEDGFTDLSDGFHLIYYRFI